MIQCRNFAPRVMIKVKDVNSVTFSQSFYILRGSTLIVGLPMHCLLISVPRYMWYYCRSLTSL